MVYCKYFGRKNKNGTRFNTLRTQQNYKTRNELPSKKKKILSRIALRRTGEPDDIAKAILFLIQSANYDTGQNIEIDGGRKLNM